MTTTSWYPFYYEKFIQLIGSFIPLLANTIAYLYKHDRLKSDMSNESV